MKRKNIYFNDIADVPLWNWWKINDTGNFIYLVPDGDYTKEDFSEAAKEAYSNLTSQLISKYGIADNYFKILQKKKRYLIMINDGYASDDKHKVWKAERLREEIKQTESEENGGNREDTLVIIHKFVGGGPINPKQISLDQYYYYMDYVNRDLKAQAKTQKDAVNG